MIIISSCCLLQNIGFVIFIVITMFSGFKRRENNYHVADVKSGKSETEVRAKALSASILELKK